MSIYHYAFFHSLLFIIIVILSWFVYVPNSAVAGDKIVEENDIKV